MTDLRTAAQQALEALELVTDLTNHDDEIYEAINNLRAALAQEQAEPICKCDLRTRLVGDGCEVCNPKLAAQFAQEQAEPVAWMVGSVLYGHYDCIPAHLLPPAQQPLPLYTAPPKPEPVQEPVQEPVALVRTWHKGEEQHAELLDWGIGVDALPDGEHTLYPAPPKREPLTDEEIERIRADEREACAKVCEDDVRTWSHPGSITREECAAAIRARSKA